MKKIYSVLFIIYIIILLKITVFRVATLTDYNINLSLFTDLIRIYKYGTSWEFIRLFIGNIVWFVPLGILLPILLKKNTLVLTMLCGAGFSLIIEITQLVTKKGVCEIDDLILNTIGTVIGTAIYKIIQHLRKEKMVECS